MDMKGDDRILGPLLWITIGVLLVVVIIEIVIRL